MILDGTTVMNSRSLCTFSISGEGKICASIIPNRIVRLISRTSVKYKRAWLIVTNIFKYGKYGKFGSERIANVREQLILRSL